jgi:hypothetical protein
VQRVQILQEFVFDDCFGGLRSSRHIDGRLGKCWPQRTANAGRAASSQRRR